MDYCISRIMYIIFIFMYIYLYIKIYIPYILRSAQTLFGVRTMIIIKVLYSVDTEEYNLMREPHKMRAYEKRPTENAPE